MGNFKKSFASAFPFFGGFSSKIKTKMVTRGLTWKCVFYNARIPCEFLKICFFFIFIFFVFLSSLEGVFCCFASLSSLPSLYGAFSELPKLFFYFFTPFLRGPAPHTYKALRCANFC